MEILPDFSLPTKTAFIAVINVLIFRVVMKFAFLAVVTRKSLVAFGAVLSDWLYFGAIHAHHVLGFEAIYFVRAH